MTKYSNVMAQSERMSIMWDSQYYIYIQHGYENTVTSRLSSYSQVSTNDSTYLVSQPQIAHVLKWYKNLNRHFWLHFLVLFAFVVRVGFVDTRFVPNNIVWHVKDLVPIVSVCSSLSE